MITTKVETKKSGEFVEVSTNYQPQPGEVVRETKEHNGKVWTITRPWPDKINPE